MESSYDVLVAGGGPAGVIAAIQAARAGVSVLLVEKTGMLGGIMTQSGIAHPGIFQMWGRQVIAGIGWEFICRTLREMGEPVPEPKITDEPHWKSQVRLNGPMVAMICDEMVLESGAELLLHTMPAAVAREDNRWKVTLCTKTGLVDCTCAVLIDGTGDANLVTLAGCDVIHPDIVQPGSYSCRLSGNGIQNAEALAAAFQEAVKAGTVKATDGAWNTTPPSPCQFLRGGNNGNHICGIRAHDSAGKTHAETEGRAAILRMLRWARTQPGLEKIAVEYLCPECGIRETVMIRGKATVTIEDYEAGRVFDEAICCMYYPVDEHTATGGGLVKRDLPKNIVPTIPRGALLPEGSENLIVAGRTLSSDHMANSGLRVQAACMAMGQAAGAMAALTAQTGTEVSRLPMGDIRALLLQHGAILP